MSFEWDTITKIEASDITARWSSLELGELAREFTSVEIQKGLGNKEEKWRKFRHDMWQAVREAERIDPSRKYRFDNYLGKKLFIIMSDMGFGVRQASYNPVWYYISLIVVPDIVDLRWRDAGSSKISSDRFWKTNMRIYLKQLWWYYYLSLVPGPSLDCQVENTWKMLDRNTTDTVVQLVDRAGNAGFRVDLWRAIIRYYSMNSPVHVKKEKWLRKTMVYNTFRLAVVEPALVEGGIDRYVQDIFAYTDREED